MQYIDFTNILVQITVIGTFVFYIISEILVRLNSKFVNEFKTREKYEELTHVHPLIPKTFSFEKHIKSAEYENEYSKLGNIRRPILRLFTSLVGICCVYPLIMKVLMRYSVFAEQPLAVLICTVIVMDLIEALIAIPFSLYTTFVIEKKYGFNRQSFILWLADTVKFQLISSAISAIMVSAAYFMIKTFICVTGFNIASATFVIAAIAISTVFNLLYESVYINLIQPLFNKYTLFADPVMTKKIMDLVTTAGFNVSGIYVVDASKRSGHGNAYFCGWGSCKRIVIYDTLFENHSDDEIIAVLAHEVGHLVHKDIFKSRVVDTVCSTIAVAISVCLVSDVSLYKAFGFDWITSDNIENWYLVGFALSQTIIGAVQWILTPVLSWFSRKMEYAADQYAKMVGYGDALQTGLIRLAADNLSFLKSHPWFVFWYFDHPQLIDRIKTLK